MNSPLVSICIPTYNRPEYLRRAVESCLAQTYPNFEIVITDNSATPDNSNNYESAEMVKRTWTDQRIRYFKNEGSIGTEASCNRAVSLSQGKYIKFLMDDDLLKPRCLECMIKGLEANPTAGLATAPMELIDENDTRFFPKFYGIRTMRYRYRYQVGDGLIDRRQILQDFLTRDYPCTVPSGIMFRTEAMQAIRRTGKVPAGEDFAGDLDLCMRVAVRWDYYYIDEVLSSFRYVESSHTARLHKEGLNPSVFYHFTRQFLGDDAVKEMFRDQWDKIVRDSLFFCSFRAASLNGIAAVRSFNPGLLLRTLKTILKEDGLLSILRLPFAAFSHFWLSIFPPSVPPARE